MSSCIVIGGGVGPMAGLDLHRRIIEQTRTDGTDQDHLRVLHVSFSDMVADRSESLASGEPERPARGMAAALLAAESTVRALGTRAVVGIPCNTFHAPDIWNPFTAALKKQGSALEVLHMIELTLAFIRERVTAGGTIGILSTTGTRRAGIYEQPLVKAGYRAAAPSHEGQQMVHAAIYAPNWGIKAVSPVSDRAKGVLYAALSDLVSRGAEAVILGCTEIPLAVGPVGKFQGAVLIDPVAILARALIEAAAPGRSSKGV